MLEDELYILPGYTKSNLSDTYYVNQISKYLNIELQTNTYEYCLKNKIKILDGTPVEIYYFLDLLENNEMLSIVQNDKDDIINNLCTILEEIIEKGINLEDYSLLNSIFKSFEIMEFEYFLSEERSNKLFEGFQSAENLEINIYYLGDFIELISILGYEQNVVCDFCKILEDDLMVLLQSKKCNKLLLLGKSLSIFEKCNYKISKECLELTMRMVNDSRDKSGLYRSGNEEDEMVGYNNTYYALRIADYIEIMAE